MDKFEEFFRILNEWMYLHEKGRSLNDIFREKQIRKIAIYGIGDCAIHLINEFAETDVIRCIIVDEKAEYDFTLPVVTAGEKIEDIDLIISTFPSADADRSSQLSDLYHCKVVSLADVVFELI